MRLLRISIAAALLSAGLALATAPGEAFAANECPCRHVGSACIPDTECEAALRRENPLPQSRRGFRRATRNGAAPGADIAPGPTAAPSAPPVVGGPPSPRAPSGDARSLPEGRRPASANGHPQPAPGGERAAPSRLRILETGYSHLTEFGKEAPGFGLYSYVILPSNSPRAARFLAEVLREIPAIGDTSARPAQLNILYLPLRKDKETAFTAMLQGARHDAAGFGAQYAGSFYDYRMARGLLDHICNPPDRSVQDLCNGDLSRGPYIFTYASEASRIEPVPPPYLFVDLSDVHERAFGEFLAAFQAQVKRDDITDQARIRTLRLRILNIALTAADWVGPVQKAVADIARSAGDK